MNKVLILASVASMIDQFNMPNIQLLQDMGYSVDVACNFIEGSTCSDEKIKELKCNLKKMGVRCYQIDFARDISNITSNLKALWQVENLMKRNNYQFVHCHSPIGGVVGRLAARKTKTKVIYTAHGFHFYKGAPKKNWLIYYPIEKICSYMTDVLICINKEDYTLAQKKMKAKRIEYVPGIGINLDKFGVKQDATINKRQELEIPMNKFWILSVGELIERKNHDKLIRAVAELPHVYLTIAGKGELHDYYQDLIKQKGIQDQVKLIGFRTDVSELCEAADAFAFPSYQEGLPVSLMEAMACGKAVVCSNIRGNTDLIEDNKGGYLFDPDNVEEIILSLEKLISSDLEKMGNYNRSVIKQFDLVNVLKDSRNIYNRI